MLAWFWPRGAGASRRRRPNPRRRPVSIWLERLEDRTLFSVSIQEFGGPTSSAGEQLTAGSGPYAIVAGPDGNLYFTEYTGNRIGEFNPTTHAVQEFSGLKGNSPWGITLGSDGNIWFTEKNGPAIGQFNLSTHAIQELSNSSLPANTYPEITSGPDGNLWYTENQKIAVLSPSSLSLQQVSLQHSDSFPVDITTGPDGNLWYTSGSYIGVISPKTGVDQEFELPGGNQTFGITAGTDGFLWFTTGQGNHLGKIDPTSGNIQEVGLAAGTDPYWITTGSDGNIWFTETNNPQIGVINPLTYAISYYQIPSGNPASWIMRGPDGNLWFSELGGNKIGEVVLSPTITSLSPNSVPANSSGFTLTVTGNNFTTGATVLWNGTGLTGTGTPTTTTLQALVPASLVANTGTAQISVLNGNVGGGSSTTLALSITNPVPSITVTASPSPAVFGQSVTLTATVVADPSQPGIPTGTVTFDQGSTVLGTATLAVNSSTGLATGTISTTALTTGTDSITVFYSGDRTYLAANTTLAPLTEQVNQDGTNTSVAASTGTITYGQMLTITATVAAGPPGSGTPTGTVGFADGNTALAIASLPVNAGTGLDQATFATAALGAGVHSLNTYYLGDSNFSTSDSTAAPASVTINQAATTVSVSPSLSSTTYGQMVTFTATVGLAAPGAGTPTGSVVFDDGSQSIGTASLLVDSKTGLDEATLTASSLIAGTHAINVFYQGDSNFTGSDNTAQPLSFTVNAANTTTALTASMSVMDYSQTLTLTATVGVVSPGAGTPAGTITFQDGTNVLGSQPLAVNGSNGLDQATFTVSNLTVGSHTLYANYSDTSDSNFNPSDSTGSGVSLTVNQDISFSGALPATTVNVAYTQTITVSLGTGDKALTVSNISGPTDGLSIPSSGTDTITISGTPTTDGTVTFTVTATDATGETVSQDYSILVNPAISLAPDTLLIGTFGFSYDQTITASGGTGDISLSVVNVANPLNGINIPTSGTNSLAINGMASQLGTMTFTVNATDTVGATFSENFFLEVDLLTFDPQGGTLPAETAGVPYNLTVTATGGDGDKTVAVSNVSFGSVVGMDVPVGSTNQATITGDPTSTGTVTFTLTETDASGHTNVANYSLPVIAAAPAAVTLLTDPQTLTAGQPSSLVTAELLDRFGNIAKSPAGGLTLNLSTDSATGTFLSAGGKALPVPSGITLAKGASTGSFEYEDTRTSTPTLRIGTASFSTTQQETVNAAPPSAVVFLTGAQTLTAGSPSALITVQLRDPYDNIAQAGNGGLVLGLSSTSAGGSFLDGNGTALPKPATITILQGASTGNFEYVDTKAATPTVTVAAPTFSKTQQQTVGPAGPAALVFLSNPQTFTAGQATPSITVQLQDPYDNPTQAGSGGVTLSLASTSAAGAFLDSSGNPLSSPPALVIAQGAGTGAFEYTDTSAGSPMLTVSATGYSQTQAETVQAAAATHLALQVPAQTIAGGNFNVTVDALDPYGNIDPTYNGPVTVGMQSGPAGALAGTTIGALQAGVATFSNLSLNLPGNFSLLAATNASLVAGVSSAIAVSPTTQFGVSPVGSAKIVAGNMIEIAVTALTAAKKPDPSYLGTIHFTSTDPQASLPSDYTFQPGDQGKATFTFPLYTAGSQTITVTDITQLGAKGTSSAFTVSPAAIYTFRVSGMSPAVSGVAHAFTVTAIDMYGNTVPTYRGKVQFSGTGGSASLPAPYTFTAKDKGVHVFSATLDPPGSGPSLTAQDTANNLTGTESNITVLSPATHLVVTVQQASVSAGQQVTVLVSALNGANLPDSSFQDVLHFASSDPNAQVPVNPTFTSTNGQASFAVVLTTAGTQTITVTDVTRAYIKGGTVRINVAPLNTSKLLVTGYPASDISGTAHPFTVTAVDMYNNRTPGYRGQVQFSAAGGGNLPAPYTFTAADKGLHVFTGTLTLPGTTQSLVVTDSANSFTGSEPNISLVSPATHLSLTASPASVTAGQQITLTLSALSGSNHPDIFFGDMLHFSSTDPHAVLPADQPFSAGSGVQTFAASLLTAGKQTITVTDISRSGVKGTSIGIAVGAGTATGLNVSGFPSPALAGTTHGFTVTAVDGYGNIASSFRGSVQLSVSDGSDTPHVLTSGYTFTTADKGKHLFTTSFQTAGTWSLTASSGGMSGAESGIQATSLTANLSGPSLGVPGQPLSFTFSAAEPGQPADAQYTYRIDWVGNGKTVQVVSGGNSITVTHVYPAVGTYVVRVTVVDGAGNTSPQAAAQGVSIEAVALETDPLDSSKRDLAVGGTPVTTGGFIVVQGIVIPILGPKTISDTIILTPNSTDPTGKTIAVSINGVAQGAFAPTGVILVYAQGPKVVVQEQTTKINGSTVSIAVPALIFGGTGTNVLSAAGSSANNVLVGGPGTNTLTGSSGQDILVGGGGASKLTAGSGGDILIAGSTSYDSNLLALLALMAEWGKSADYQTRVQDLFGPGTSSPYALAPQTVFPDTAASQLTGGAGDDWFWFTASARNPDQVTKVVPGEIATFVPGAPAVGVNTR